MTVPDIFLNVMLDGELVSVTPDTFIDLVLNPRTENAEDVLTAADAAEILAKGTALPYELAIAVEAETANSVNMRIIFFIGGSPIGIILLGAMFCPRLRFVNR